ncbi:MAG TPA: hypothetical protein VES02_09880 [Dermatophilaceae bacterium]|nr:hypothetical protein [Dermatophilaceae bacterium]
MSNEPDNRPQPRPLAQPFPRPGRLLEHAYWELSIAANGTPEQVKALGDLRRLPRPWDPPTCTHPDLRLELWVWLDDVVTWINHEYVWDTEAFIPACWPEHPHLVHDLAVLADQRRRAGTANTSDALEDWHRYALPAFLDRMAARLKSHCEDGHQPWPSIGRQARHSSDPHRRRRIRSFKEDSQKPLSETPDATPHRPRLSVVDGDVVDTQTGELL